MLSKSYNVRASDAALGIGTCVGEGGREPGSFIEKRLGGGVVGGVADEPKRLLRALDDAADNAETEFDRDRTADGRWDRATRERQITLMSVDARVDWVLFETM